MENTNMLDDSRAQSLRSSEGQRLENVVAHSLVSLTFNLNRRIFSKIMMRLIFLSV